MNRFSDRTLRYLVAATISLLLIFQIGTLIAGLFGMAWGAASAVVVAAVSLFSSRMARASGKSSLWFLAPTLLFTVVPMALTVWNVFTNDASWFDRLLSLTPFVVGFALPLILLLLVYFELRNRTR